MSSEPTRSMRRKMRILVITGVVGVLVIAGAFAGWKIRKGMMIRSALTTGNAAYEHADWDTARRMLGRYLSAYPDDPDVLAKYARAQLAIRPLAGANIVQAMNAYRSLLRVEPKHDLAFERLALLYETTGDFAELAQIAANRRAVRPNDPAAILALAKSAVYRQKSDEARADLDTLLRVRVGGAESRRELVEGCLLLARLEMQEGGTVPDRASLTKALQWLDRAVQYDPDSAAALVRHAALRRELAKGTPRESGPAGQGETEGAAELTKAEGLATSDPRALLQLSEEWMARRMFDRAATQLATAERIAPQVLENFYVDPDDWVLARSVQAAKLSLLTGAADDGVRLAQTTLTQLKDRPQRAQFLPAAVELLVAGQRLAEARDALAEFLEAAKLAQNTAEREEQAAFLQALVARAEDQPYRVIDHLEPVADRAAMRPMVRVMLAEAYARTGQSRRATQVLARAAAEGVLNADMAELLARGYVQQGAWREARDVLSRLAQIRSATLETTILELTTRFGLVMESRMPTAEGTLTALADELAALREAHPDHVEIRVLLAAIAERRGQTEAAVAELEQARAQCVESLPATLALVRLYTNRGETDKAREVLELQCQQHGTQTTAWLALSDLLVGQQHPDEARAKLRAAQATITDPADKRQIALRLATLDIMYGDASQGTAALWDLAARDPQDVEARALLLELPEVLRDTAAAQKLVDEIKNIEGGSGLLWRLHQARLWLAGADWQARQKEIEELLRYYIGADPGRAAPVLVLGAMYEKTGDLSSAETLYASSFEAGGATEVADRWLALLLRQKRYPDARTVLDRLKQKLDDRSVAARRLWLDVGAGQYDEAINELELRVGGVDQDPLDLVRLAGLTYTQTKHADRALIYLDRAVALGADPATVARVRVGILKAEQRFTEAETVLNELVNSAPTAEAFFLRAWYHMNVNRADLAEQDCLAFARVADDASGPGTLADFYGQTGRLDEAINTWQEGLRRFPDSVVLKRGLTKALLRRGQPGDRERGGTLLAELRARRPDDTELLALQATEKASQATPEALAEARQLLKNAVRSQPAAVDTYMGLGSLALLLDDLPTARDLALRGQREHPGDTGLLLLQARTEFALQNLDAAGALTHTVLLQDPQNLPAHALRVEVARLRHDSAALQDELAAVTQLIQADPGSEMLQLVRARILMGLDQNDTALAALEDYRTTETGRQSVPVLLLLQELYQAKKDFAAAHQRLDAAAVLAPENPVVLQARLALLADEKRLDDISALMRDQASGANRRLDLLISAATKLGSSPAHLAAAAEFAQRATELAPHDPSAYLVLGELRYQQGDPAAAERAFRAALGENPALPDALNNLAWVLAESRAASEEALTHARKAVTLRPENANYRDTLGFVFQKLGKPTEALAEFRRGVELAPPDSALRAKLLAECEETTRLLKPAQPGG